MAETELQPWQRPPFEPGNVVALKSGAYSERAIAEQAAEVHARLLEVAPELGSDPRYLPSVARYLRAAAREELCQAVIAKWQANPKGNFPTRLVETATAAARLADQLGRQLGLDPGGHAELRKLMAETVTSEVTANEQLERGRQLVEARRARLAAETAQETLDEPQAVDTPENAPGAVQPVDDDESEVPF